MNNVRKGHTHVIPVDNSQTVEEAWEELCLFGRRVTFSDEERWDAVECDGEECRNVEWAGISGTVDPQ